MLKNALIHMYASFGEIEAPFGVFKTMKQRTTVSWTRIVKHGYGDEAPCVCQLMESSKDSSVRPEEITFLGVPCACNHSSYVEERQHFGCMVDLLSRAGLLDKAHELVKSMPMKPNIQFRVPFLVDELDPHQATRYFLLLSNVYDAAKKWQDVVAVRRKMLDTKTRKPPGRSRIQIEESMEARFQGCFVYSVDDFVGIED
ncbi:hypothetical protein CDL12_00231 [Handroanthus impetiginosus]|uniref:Pentatricopeptide repeat-containing protein n=1 Tax=Handroanthus impetiginosus TaxID=429701 RepID=A0A2G9IB87_9LAMI|nr:hypothetical protein CDL12_00231 [Handroanthus impetiginosus]